MSTPATFSVTLTLEQGERLEDLEDEEWAQEMIAEWEASDKQTRPASELWAELGL